MKTLVFATNNPHKINEIKAMLGDQYQFLSLADIGCSEDIPETKNTIEANAIQKAMYVQEKYGYPVFAEDTGLEIDALDGEPGVYSARYAGPERDDQANMKKVLKHLEDKKDRTARFKTVIALIVNGQTHTFEGLVYGEILKQAQGNKGFGYDPIFRPKDSTKTFAEMAQEEKAKISHRGRSMQKLQAFLNKIEMT